MFEPKEGTCFHCTSIARFPSNWRNDWFICDECLNKVLPLLRRKVPASLVLKSDRKLKYDTEWKPFKRMSLDLMRATLDFALQNDQLTKTFVPSLTRCDGAFELDEEHGLVRIETNRGTYSPIIYLPQITDYYVQDVYRMGHYSSTPYYDHSELSIETSCPHVPFVDFPFAFPKSHGHAMNRKKRMRQEADQELAAILGRATSDTRKRIIPEYDDMMEFNPYSASTSDDFAETARDMFRSPE